MDKLGRRVMLDNLAASITDKELWYLLEQVQNGRKRVLQMLYAEWKKNARGVHELLPAPEFSGLDQQSLRNRPRDDSRHSSLAKPDSEER